MNKVPLSPINEEEVIMERSPIYPSIDFEEYDYEDIPEKRNEADFNLRLMKRSENGPDYGARLMKRTYPFQGATKIYNKIFFEKMLIILEIKTNQNQAKSNEGGDNALGRYKRSEIDLNSRIMKRNSAQFRQMLIIYFNPNPVS